LATVMAGLLVTTLIGPTMPPRLDRDQKAGADGATIAAPAAIRA
jgi:hypothetical protein